MKLRHFAVFGGIFTVIICLLLFLFIVTADDEENSTSYFDFSGLNLSEEVLKHQPTVEKYAKEYNIDKYMVYAIIKAESNFNENAKSSSDAIGLMQIMEITAIETARKMDLEVTEEDSFF